MVERSRGALTMTKRANDSRKNGKKARGTSIEVVSDSELGTSDHVASGSGPNAVVLVDGRLEDSWDAVGVSHDGLFVLGVWVVSVVVPSNVPRLSHCVGLCSGHSDEHCCC